MSELSDQIRHYCEQHLLILRFILKVKIEFLNRPWIIVRPFDRVKVNSASIDQVLEDVNTFIDASILSQPTRQDYSKSWGIFVLSSTPYYDFVITKRNLELRCANCKHASISDYYRAHPQTSEATKTAKASTLFRALSALRDGHFLHEGPSPKGWVFATKKTDQKRKQEEEGIGTPKLDTNQDRGDNAIDNQSSRKSPRTLQQCVRGHTNSGSFPVLTRGLDVWGDDELNSQPDESSELSVRRTVSRSIEAYGIQCAEQFGKDLPIPIVFSTRLQCSRIRSNWSFNPGERGDS